MRKRFYRFTSIVLASVLMAFSFSGCSDKKTEESSKEETAKSDKDTKDYAETVEPQVLFDNSGVKVSVVSMAKSDTYGKFINYDLVNNTSEELIFDCKEMAVNNQMVTDLFCERVSANNSMKSHAFLYSDKLDYVGLNPVGEIVVQFDILKSSDYSVVYSSDYITIKTSEFDNMVTKASFDGKKIYDDNDITMSAKYVKKDDLYDNTLLLYTQNATDKYLGVVCDKMTIDGKDMGTVFVSQILSGDNALDAITITDDEFKAAGIDDPDKIQKIEIQFHFYDKKEVKDICQTKLITIDVK